MKLIDISVTKDLETVRTKILETCTKIFIWYAVWLYF